MINLDASVKMRRRLLIIFVAVFCLDDTSGGILQRDSHNISNIFSNNAGRFQKGVHQLSSNRAAALQNSLSSLRSANSQQNHNTQVQNFQSPATSHLRSTPSPSSHSGLHSFHGNQAKNLQQTMMQQQQKFQQNSHPYEGNNSPFNGNTFDQHNPMLNEQIIDQSPGLSSYSGLSQHSLLHSQGYPASLPSQFQDNLAYRQADNINMLSDVNPHVYQNSQAGINGMPSYALDRTPPGNLMQSPQYNQSPYLASYPHTNQQGVEYGLTGTASQYSVINNSGQPSVSPYSLAAYTNPPVAIQSSAPVSYRSLPVSTSVSSYPRESSSSNLDSLLPLILNLIQDSNSCDCCQQCGCRNMKNNMQSKNTSGTSGGRCGCKNETPRNRNTLGTNEDKNFKNSNSRSSGKKTGKSKIEKTEDSYEDYDDQDDEDIGDLDYD